VKLGQVAEFINGDRGKNYPSEGDFAETGIPFINAGHLTNGEVDFSEMNYISESRFNLLGSGKTRENDILYCLRGSLGKTAIVRQKGNAAIASSLVIIRPSDECSVAYVYHFLTSPFGQVEMRKFDNGSSQPNLSANSVKSYLFPLPPLAEQRRIAEVLNRADALRAKRHAALARLDSLTQSLFLDLFGDLATNPKGWPIRTIADVSECLDKLRKPVKESERVGGPIPYYGANGLQGWIDRAIFDEPLVLVAEDGGHFDNPARGVAYRIDGPAWVNNHAHVLRPRSGVVEVEYLHRALRHYDFTPYISGTTRSKLTQGQLNVAKVLLPPIELQREFARRVTAVEALKTAQSASLAELDALFATLQHRAFKGEL
jgi:type I restriction enzyme S subunit